jgi:hypothetical protein
MSNIRNKARATLKIRFLVVKPFLNSRKDFRNIETEFYHFLKARKQGITPKMAQKSDLKYFKIQD